MRIDPLRATDVGAFVRGLSVRDVESLCEEAGLGRTSKSTVFRICSELHERFEAFCRRDLYVLKLVVLLLDAIYPFAGAFVHQRVRTWVSMRHSAPATIA